jgi:hypothetical protein
MLLIVVLHPLNCRAEGYGGAVLAEGSSSVAFAGRSEGNTASRHGGGFASRSTASIALLSGATFVQDKAVGSGGCAYFGDGVISLRKWRPLIRPSF